MNEPKVYMMCGVPFAGKSTLARVLAQHLGAVHLETDAINTERGLGLSGAAISAKEWAITYREAHQRLQSLLQAGRSVVYDAANYRRLQRDRIRHIARQCGATTQVVWVATPVADAQERLRLNRQQPVRLDVRDEDFGEVVERFQPPTSDEDVVRYDGTQPINELFVFL